MIRRTSQRRSITACVLADTASAATAPVRAIGATKPINASAIAWAIVYVVTWRRQARHPVQGCAPAARRSAVGAPLAAAVALVCTTWSPIWCPA